MFRSLVSADEIDKVISGKVLKLISVVQKETNGGEARAIALKELWNLSNNDNNKVILCRPELGLLKILRTVLLSQQGGGYDDRPSIKYCIYCLWYLSRELKNRIAIVTVGLDFVSILLSFLSSDEEELKEPIMKTLSNCVLSFETHRFLLCSSRTNDEEGLFSFCFQRLPRDNLSANSTYHRFFANIVTVLRKENIGPFIEFPVVTFMIRQLYSFGAFPKLWANRVSGIPYWCLNFLMSFSSVPEGAKILHSIIIENRNLFIFWKKLMDCEQLEGLKAAILVMNVLGAFSSNCSSDSCFPFRLNEKEEYPLKPGEREEYEIIPLFVRFSHLFDLFLDVYHVHFFYDTSKTEVSTLASQG
jgi:hypothetical protein